MESRNGAFSIARRLEVSQQSGLSGYSHHQHGDCSSPASARRTLQGTELLVPGAARNHGRGSGPPIRCRQDRRSEPGMARLGACSEGSSGDEEACVSCSRNCPLRAEYRATSRKSSNNCVAPGPPAATTFASWESGPDVRVARVRLCRRIGRFRRFGIPFRSYPLGSSGHDDPAFRTEGWTKVAIYGDADGYTYAARQLHDGRWTSKLGSLQRIFEHRSCTSLDGLSGPIERLRRSVVQIVKKRRWNAVMNRPSRLPVTCTTHDLHDTLVVLPPPGCPHPSPAPRKSLFARPLHRQARRRLELGAGRPQGLATRSLAFSSSALRSGRPVHEGQQRPQYRRCAHFPWSRKASSPWTADRER